MARACETHTLTVAPHNESLAAVRAFVQRIAAEAGFDEARVFDAQVAVSEATANAVEHGRPETPLEIGTRLFSDRLEIDVFSQSEFELPAIDYVRSSGAHRGMGFPLMAKLSDHLALYSRVAGGTLVTLTFFRAGYEDDKAPRNPLPPSQLELVTQHQLLTAILEASPVGIVVLDPDLRFRWANAAYLRFLDEPHLSCDLVGVPLAEVLPSIVETARAVSETGEPIRKRGFAHEGFARGTTYWNAHMLPLKHDGQDPPYDVLVVLSEVTEQVLADQKVRRKLDIILSPEGDLGRLDLVDIIDAPGIQSLLSDFHRLAGIPLAIIDLEGKVLVGAGWSQICTRFHRRNPETRANCVESDTVLTRGIHEGEFTLYRCKNHMWDVATPILVGGEHVGNVFSGQFFFDDEVVDQDLFRAQARKYGFDEEAYLAALDSVPRLSRETVDIGMSFFAKLAALLSSESYGRIRLARALAER
jgi:ligand-binding sensor protein/anti-sigma regulatory factor (Ser/Thr protein kinase)